MMVELKRIELRHFALKMGICGVDALLLHYLNSFMSLERGAALGFAKSPFLIGETYGWTPLHYLTATTVGVTPMALPYCSKLLTSPMVTRNVTS